MRPRQAKTELEHLETRQRILNELTPANVQARLVELLPDIAEKLPKPQELRSVSIGGSGGAQDGQGVATLVAQMLALTNLLKADGSARAPGQAVVVSTGGKEGKGEPSQTPAPR